jgi:hypothetical protein
MRLPSPERGAPVQARVSLMHLIAKKRSSRKLRCRLHSLSETRLPLLESSRKLKGDEGV